MTTSEDRGRLERERSYHDERFGDNDGRAAAGKYYSVTRSSSDHLDQLIDGVAPGARVLELGCGVKSVAPSLAQRGVRVVSIDISPVAVARMRDRLRAEAVDDRASVDVMNAEELAFPSGSFDAVVGTGILHHLHLDRVCSELSRVLRTDGRAFFVEPTGANPVINLYRRATPSMRTPDEHPLVESDMEIARRWFGRVDVTYFHALALLAVPLRRTRAFEGALDLLERGDDRMFRRWPASRRLAWTVVMDLGDPRPSRSSEQG